MRELKVITTIECDILINEYYIKEDVKELSNGITFIKADEARKLASELLIAADELDKINKKIEEFNNNF